MTTIRDAFGQDPEVQARGSDAIDRLSAAVHELAELMQGDDGGGEVRVGHMLVKLGARLAGIEPGATVRVPR